MKLLINEPALQTLPTLATKLGLNEAIVLQQLHFRLSNSPLRYGGYTWFLHTYSKWQKQFPFWSERTISRIFLALENQGIIVSTQHYNEMKINKTKWYRIDYDVLYAVLGCQTDLLDESDCQLPSVSILSKVEQDLDASDLKDLKKEEKKNNVPIISEIVSYLNQKAKTAFRVNNKATKRLINGRLSEGYTLQDFKTVIDRKVLQWLANPEMKPYLRPSTLFSPTNFENYLNDSTNTQVPKKNTTIQPIVLDFDAGEEEEDKQLS
ncbi:conserved phage C-terminal domain-containing protein [Lysinibacillus sp. SGAir0095]|uniref:conserved phage C-terminal domain-containing protein n=1 Tax=Lysinibacillus sp. SGAir0095 TaxID=2070463 RepID=UPI0010CCB672|nr:conserved phage C-terminal domain-containing protein [Lysinibacillus sp. SGAir0095]QCR31027.1 replication protein [Lysinibacillus sp. SGAir0095]